MTDARPGVGMDSTISQVKDQERRLSLSLGCGTSQSIIDSATRVLSSAPRHPDYVKFDQVPFVYEKLGGKETNDAVKIVVDNWTQVGFADILANTNAYFEARYRGTFTAQHVQWGEVHPIKRQT